MANYRPAVIGLIFFALSLSFPSVLAQNDRTIFFDDFEDGDLAGWDLSFAGDAVEVINLDGNKVLHITGEQNDYISLGFLDNLNGSNVLEARMMLLDLGTGDGSMNFNLMSENPGHGSGYSALISTGGGFLADRNGGFRAIDTVTNANFQLELNHWYTVRFQLNSRLLNLLVDGQSVRLASMEPRQNGEPVFIFDRGMEVYLDDVRIEHPDFVAPATETPQIVVATAQAVPTRHPQDLPNDRLVPVDVVLATAPRSYRWELTDGRFVFDTRTIRIRPENLGTIVDIYGNPIQHGLYTPNNPPPILPELLPQPLEINGRMAEYGYVVGTVAFGVRDPGTQFEAMFAAVTFFAEGSGDQVNVVFELDNLLSNASTKVQGETGHSVDTPSNDRGQISLGTNTNQNIVIDTERRTISIPTDNGPIIIHEGDEIMLGILFNQEISNYARSWGDQMPSRWSQTVFDNNSNNNPDLIKIEPIGLIVSNREATSLSSAQTVESSPTSTPQEVAATTQPAPTLHPQDLPNDRLVPVDVVLATAPRSYRWDMTFVVNIQGNDGVIRREPRTFDTRNIRILQENLGTIIDTNGNPTQHGVYTPNTPPLIQPELFPQLLEINGTMAEYGYVVGTFAFGVAFPGTEHEDAIGALTFFAEGNNNQVDIEFHVDELLNNVSIAIQGVDGSKISTPSDNRGRIPIGSDPSRNIVIDYDNRTITIPTANGLVVIREGDEIMLAILWNQNISNYARGWGDQLPATWSQTMFDNNPNNDAQEIFVQVMGLIVSDRSTRSGE